MSISDGLHLAECTIGRAGAPLLRRVSIALAPGEIVALEGPNGIGKTTLVETIAGLTPLLAGAITLDGVPLHDLRVHQRVRRGVRFVRDRQMLFPYLSVRENFALAGVAPDHAPDWAPSLVQKVWRQRAATLSGGERRVSATAVALQAQPRLLIIDEFVEGLQHSVVRDLIDVIQRHARDDGMMALLVSQSDLLAQQHGLRNIALARLAA